MCVSQLFLDECNQKRFNYCIIDEEVLLQNYKIYFLFQSHIHEFLKMIKAVHKGIKNTLADC